jgi:hypothetical protein
LPLGCLRLFVANQPTNNTQAQRSTHIKQAFHRKVHQQDTDFVIMTSTVEATFVGTIFWNIF